jgi:mRNA interferase MazF
VVAPAAGAVVLVRLPLSDLSQSKLRPAVVLAEAGRGDWILFQVTSKSYGDARAIRPEDLCFATGSLRVTSYARPGKLFTANRNLMVAEVTRLTAESLKAIVDAVIHLLRSPATAGGAGGHA